MDTTTICSAMLCNLEVSHTCMLHQPFTHDTTVICAMLACACSCAVLCIVQQLAYKTVGNIPDIITGSSHGTTDYVRWAASGHPGVAAVHGVPQQGHDAEGAHGEGGTNIQVCIYTNLYYVCIIYIYIKLFKMRWANGIPI